MRSRTENRIVQFLTKPQAGKRYEFLKDGFKHGEYSIYLRHYNNGQIASEFYCFGVSKQYEAKNACAYLNHVNTL